ncbi:PIN domain-containing protein [soil metagenome]
MTTKVFLDTAYAIALSVESDAHHERAEELAGRLEAGQTRLVTTRAILLEIGNALSKQRYRKAAIELLDALEEDPTVEIVPLSEELYQQARELFRQRPDKEWGLVDCVSIIVMKERGLTEALTTDEHFKQAGFRALLRDK